MNDGTQSSPPAPDDVTRPAGPESPVPDITGITGDLPPRNLVVGGEVARGGMGAVLYAKDLNIRRSVAMKVILPDKQISAESLLRFVEEAQVTGQLEHPGIVPIHDLGMNEHGQPFYTMKLVKGVTLKEVIAKLAAGDKATVEKYTPGHLLMVFQKVCDAVAFAHSKGVVHRDLKPENIMMGDYGEVFVMDWGLAKIIGRPTDDSAVGSARVGESDVCSTMDGTIMGTPQFMSPEQAEGQVGLIDARTDIYALGAILYNMLTLQPPVDGATVEEVLAKVRKGAVMPPAQGSQVPEALSAVAMKAMAKAPPNRYQSVAELQRDIEAYQTGFATGAEQAGAFKLLWLLVKRHKAEFGLSAAALAIIIALVASFMSRIIAGERRAVVGEKQAKDALAELRDTAPAHYNEAVNLIQEHKFEDALKKINYAVSLQPKEAQYHYLKGNILESLFQVSAAREAYSEALQRQPDHKLARENFDLCEKILRDSQGLNNPRPTALVELHAAMRRQGRYDESLAMLQEQLPKHKQLLLDACQALLKEAGVGGALSMDDNGNFSVDLHESPTTDFAPISVKLRGIPVTALNIRKTGITDLSSLRGMPLIDLNISFTKVTDLSPLRGMSLTHLNISFTKVTDLNPLKGMPLTFLEVGNTKISNLSPLKGMPLTFLGTGMNLVDDLSPLKDMPLTRLNITSSITTGIEVVREIKSLKEINLRPAAEFWQKYDAGEFK